MKDMAFTVSGVLEVPDDAKAGKGSDMQGNKFTLPDGRVVRVAVVLELEEDGGDSFRDLSTAAEMAEVGFSLLDYDVNYMAC